MKTNRQVQEFKVRNRKALASKRAKIRLRGHALTLASANLIRKQSLDVSRVEILDHEIEADT
jgi:hypothetical protein